MAASLPIWPSAMELVDDEGVRVALAALAGEVGMPAREVIVAVLDDVWIVLWPNCKAERDCKRRHSGQNNRRAGRPDLQARPARKWIGDQPAGM